MYFTNRYELILEILESRSVASVHLLAEELHVSEPTIRRDLAFLEKSGKLRRTFGGAVLHHENNREVPLSLREQENRPIKDRLAREAAELIHDGDTIFLDASSTASGIIPFLRDFKDLTVITNSPRNSIRLAEMKIRSFSTGGILLESSVAYIGSIAERAVECFNADLFFFSCRGVSSDGYLNDSSLEETEIRKAMMRRSERKIFLCSSDKLGKKYMYNLCSHGEVDKFICDKSPEFTGSRRTLSSES